MTRLRPLSVIALSSILFVASAASAQTSLAPPLSHARARVTKKFFGTMVAPGHSPVTPERFRGFHTGIDFETTSQEANTDVQVNAVCNGNLLRKGWVSGYGGVAVQACMLNQQAVTVIYGHLRSASIRARIGQTLHARQPFAVLGRGYSRETDGERKHLHLGIHRGSSINLRGYVQQKSQLKSWIDPLPLIGR